MKTGYWIVIALCVASAGMAAGYKVATATGIEPQHFAAVESGGYGGGADVDSLGLDKDAADYYKDLQKQ